MKQTLLLTKDLDHTPLSKQTGVKVIVEDTQIKTGGFLSGKYVSYVINTSPTNWQVSRRYSEFRRLKQLLRKFYPGYIVYIYIYIINLLSRCLQYLKSKGEINLKRI